MTRSFRFLPPEPGPDVVTRQRLLRSLVGRWHHRVTSLTGGAGLGKTTLLAQAIAENRLAPRGEDVWLGLEPRDADADRLAHVVAAALAEGRDDVPHRTQPASPIDPTELADAVWHRAPTEACLVLDDVHLLPPDSSGAAWLKAFVAGLPANGHVVMAGRGEPPVPLSRFGTQGAVLRLAEDDLRFSDDELSAFAHHRGVDRQRLAATGGWPAMAELAASVSPLHTGTYLWEEVLEPLGTLRRHVLAVLCDLGGADDELASAALGSAVDLAQSLDGVPLVARGADGWYVPHALWRDAPRLSLPPAERAEIRRRAADHLSRRGRFDEAFNLVQASDQPDAASAVLRSACLSSDRLVSSQLGRWLAVSSPAVRSSPAGQLAAGMHTALASPKDAVAPLSAAAELCREAGDIDGEVAAIAQLGRLAWWREDLPALSELLARVGELEGSGQPTARALATFARAMLADMAGDDDAVLTHLHNIESQLLDPQWEVLAAGLWASVRLDQGDTAPSHEIVERFRSDADQVLLGVLTVLQLGAWWAEGRVDDVVERIPATDARLRPTGVKLLYYLGMTGAALVYSHVGEVEIARRYLAEAIHAAPPQPTMSPTARIAITTASVQLAEGDEAGAAATLSAAMRTHGIDRGVDRRMWRQNLALSYVLVPESRPHWDAAVLHGHVLVARQLAAAVVALREGGQGAALRTLSLPSTGLVRSSLHHRFAAELAVHLSEVGRPEAPELLEALGPVGREAVRALASDKDRRGRSARDLLTVVPVPPRKAAYLAVLGPLVLRQGGRTGEAVVHPALRRSRLQALVAYLVGHRHTTRNAIAAALWPDLDDRSAANNLSVTLNHLLRLLEPSREPGEPAYLLRLDGSSVHLVTGPHLRIDVDDFDAHLAEAARADGDGAPSIALEHNLAAAGLYRDDLHAEVPEAEWFILERERYRSRFVQAAVRAGQLLLGRGDHDRAQEVASRALGVDPWSEGAYAVMVGAALASGDRSGAHRLLDRCLAVLTDLGADPSPATEQLRRRIHSATTLA